MIFHWECNQINVIPHGEKKNCIHVWATCENLSNLVIKERISSCALLIRDGGKEESVCADWMFACRMNDQPCLSLSSDKPNWKHVVSWVVFFLQIDYPEVQSGRSGGGGGGVGVNLVFDDSVSLVLVLVLTLQEIPLQRTIYIKQTNLVYFLPIPMTFSFSFVCVCMSKYKIFL